MRRNGSQLSLQLLQTDDGGTQRTKHTAKKQPALPRLSISPGEAAEMLGVSRDFFDKHIKPELRIVRRGSKTILISIAELERWLDKSAARYSV